jgi:coniferyl-aldehyde dehydrogenase
MTGDSAAIRICRHLETLMEVVVPAAQLQTAFERQRAAAAAAPFPVWSVRRDRLQRLRRLLVSHERAIAEAIDADFGGRPAIETELAEQFPSLQEVKTALRHGESWMRPRRAGVSPWFQPAGAELLPQPLGVVGIIVPWNYPLYLTVGPLVAALVAGNRALIKLSEFTPNFSQLFAQLVAREFEPTEVAVINGGPDIAEAFSSLPFDHLLFTGSTSVGRKVMAAAAANLTPVTLELGGKSPAVIAPGANLEHAVERILVGKMLNAGQTCIAPDYVLLPRADLERFVELASAIGQRMYPAGLDSGDYCSVINLRQYQRLTRQLQRARDSGVRVVPLFSGAVQDDARHRLAPVLLVDPPLQDETMADEVFGPLLPVIPIDSAEEAISFINARPRPLALYWFDNDTQRIDHMLRETHAGGVTVNDTLLHVAQDSLPFGGIGASGIGQYHGRWGFETFSKLKPVFRQARVNGMALFTPPYRPLARRLLGLMKRL